MASRTLGRWGQCLPPGRDAVQRVEYAGGRDGVEHIKIAEDQRENRIDGAPWESLQYYPLRDFWRDGKQMISA